MKLIELNTRPIKNKENKNLFAQVDDSDFEFLNSFMWYGQPQLTGKYYAVRQSLLENGKQRTVRMHMVIMNTPKGKHTDHKDGDGLNNQRNNLRICTPGQNQMNKIGSKNVTSKYKGVWYCKNKKGWMVAIRAYNKRMPIGRFKTEENAAIAYNIFAEKYHGEFANYNK